MSIASLIPSETGAALTEVPSLRHGFFGRRGGVSTGPYAALNTSETGGDTLVWVTRNRALAARELGFTAETLTTLTQVHSGQVVTITAAPEPGSRPEGDALVTAVEGIALGILTADCAPILLVDAERKIIGAVHAGWKAALSGIIGNAVGAMAALGAEPANIRAAVGPTISQENYEVGDTFKDEFLLQFQEGERYFTTPSGGKPHFDLPAFVRDQLHDSGVTQVEFVGSCTYADPERYFSFRYATHQGTVTGRQLALIGWLPPAA